MITNFRQLPVERFTPNVLRILERATMTAWRHGKTQVGVDDLEQAMDAYVLHEIAARSESELEFMRQGVVVDLVGAFE